MGGDNYFGILRPHTELVVIETELLDIIHGILLLRGRV